MQRQTFSPASISGGETTSSITNEQVTIAILEEYNDNYSHFTLRRLKIFHYRYKAGLSSSSSSSSESFDLQSQRRHNDMLIKVLSGFAVQSLVSLLAICVTQPSSSSSSPSPSSSSSSSPYTSSTTFKIFTISILFLFCSTIATIVLPARRFHVFLQVITYISTTLAFTSLASMLLVVGDLWLVYLLGAFLFAVLFNHLCPQAFLLLLLNLVRKRALRRQHVQDAHMSLPITM